MDPAVEAVLNTPEILAKIFTNIRPQLQEYRLVSKAWNEVILRYLPKRVKLSFNFEPRSYITRRPHFEAQVSRVQSLKIQNFCVMLSPRNLPREAIKDIDWFMKNYGNKMKSLDLTFWLVNAASYSMLSNIFKHLSLVEEMILKVTFAKGAAKGEKWPSPLDSVRKVGFKTVDFSAGCLERPLVINLMKLYPNMESLTVFPPKFACHALHCIAENVLQFPKLVELHIWLDGESAENTTKILECLARIPNDLQVLNLDCFPSFDENMIAAMEKVLQRHGPTLKSLRVETLYTSAKTDTNISLISFPKFPKLRRFKLRFSYCTESGQAVQPLLIKFPSGPISYEMDFPMLEDLHVCTDFENDTSLLPNESNVAEQIFLPSEVTTKSIKMKRVEFNIAEEWILPRNLEWGTQFFKRFQTVFPHASLMPMEKVVKWIRSE